MIIKTTIGFYVSSIFVDLSIVHDEFFIMILPIPESEIVLLVIPVRHIIQFSVYSYQSNKYLQDDFSLFVCQ